MGKKRVQKLPVGFPGRDPGSGRYGEVREAHRNRFHLFSSVLVSVARSYDQKWALSKGGTQVADVWS